MLSPAGPLTLAVTAVPPQGGLDRYIRRKKLDPLDTYVPLLLQAREELDGIAGTMGEPRRAHALMCLPCTYMMARLQKRGGGIGPSSGPGSSSSHLFSIWDLRFRLWGHSFPVC